MPPNFFGEIIMKKMCLTFAAFALLAGGLFYKPTAVQAAGQKSDIRNPDSGTEWVRGGSDNVQVSHKVGTVILTVNLEDVSTASTAAVAIPVTDVRVSYIQSVLLGTITTSNTNVRFWKANSDGVVQGEITNALTGIILTVTTAGASDKTGDVDTFTPTESPGFNHLGKDDVIFIHTNGASTTNSDATITITLIPR